MASLIDGKTDSRTGLTSQTRRTGWGRPGERGAGPDGSAGRAGAKPLFFGVRARFFLKQPGSIPKSGRKRQGEGGSKGFHPRFMAILRGCVGRYPVLRRADRNCFGKQTPKKGLFFSTNRGFW